MTESAARPKRTLNARIEPETWLLYEAFIRENHGSMDLDELLQSLQSRNLPVSKHQLTHQLSKWGLKKYKSRSANTYGDTGLVQPDRPTAGSTSRNSTPSQSSTLYTPIVPKTVSSSPDGKIGEMREETAIIMNSYFGGDYPATRDQYEKASNYIFGIPDNTAWRSLNKMTLSYAALLSALYWYSEKVISARYWASYPETRFTDLRPNPSLSGLLILRRKGTESEWWKEVVLDDTRIRGAYAAIGKRLQTQESLCPEFQFISSSKDVATYLYVYPYIPNCLKIQVRGVWQEKLKVLTWKMNIENKPEVRLRDKNFEFELRQLLRNLLKVSDYPTNVAYNNDPNTSYQKMTPFEVLSVATYIYYLHRYTDDCQNYPVKQAGGEEMLESFQHNVRKISQLVQAYRFHKQRLDEISFRHLILNTEMRSDSSFLSDDAPIQWADHVEVTDLRHGIISKRPRLPEALLSRSLPEEEEECNTTEGILGPGSRQSALDTARISAYPALSSPVDTSKSIMWEVRHANSKLKASISSSTTESLQEPEVQNFQGLEEIAEESEDAEDTEVSTDGNTPISSKSSPATSLDNSPTNKLEHQKVTVKLKEASKAELTPKKRSRVSTPSSESSQSGKGSRRKDKIREIIEPTLSSGVIVARDQQSIQDNVDLYGLKTLAASFLSLQVSESSSIRAMRNLKEHLKANVLNNNSLLSLSLMGSDLSSIYKDLGPVSIATESTSHGRRRKKVKRPEYAEEDEGRSNGISFGFLPRKATAVRLYAPHGENEF